MEFSVGKLNPRCRRMWSRKGMQTVANLFPEIVFLAKLVCDYVDESVRLNETRTANHSRSCSIYIAVKDSHGELCSSSTFSDWGMQEVLLPGVREGGWRSRSRMSEWVGGLLASLYALEFDSSPTLPARVLYESLSRYHITNLEGEKPRLSPKHHFASPTCTRRTSRHEMKAFRMHGYFEWHCSFL